MASRSTDGYLNIHHLFLFFYYYILAAFCQVSIFFKEMSQRTLKKLCISTRMGRRNTTLPPRTPGVRQRCNSAGMGGCSHAASRHLLRTSYVWTQKVKNQQIHNFKYLFKYSRRSFGVSCIFFYKNLTTKGTSHFASVYSLPG